MTTKLLSDITADLQYQMRVSNNSSHIDVIEASMLERIEDGEEPLKKPIAVAEFDGMTVVVDGFHRYTALLRIEYDKPFPVEVVATSEEEAFLYACKANSEHEGKSRDSGDLSKVSRKVAEWLYDNLEENVWSIKSTEVMGLCGCGKRYAYAALSDFNTELKEKRDAKILELDVEGLSQREIAKELGVNHSTVSRYLESVAKMQSAQMQHPEDNPTLASIEAAQNETPEERAEKLKPAEGIQAHAGYEETFAEAEEEVLGNPDNMDFDDPELAKHGVLPSVMSKVFEAMDNVKDCHNPDEKHITDHLASFVAEMVSRLTLAGEDIEKQNFKDCLNFYLDM